MGKIYLGQSDLTIKLTTGKNLTGITNVSLECKSPKGIRKIFNAVVIEELKGIIQYAVVSTTDFDEKGTWVIWAKVINNQGLVSYGEPATISINSVGT